MKILYVVSRPLEINTSASIRNRATLGGLLELGHSVDVITTQFDRNHSSFDESMVNNNLNVTYLELGGIQKVDGVGRKLKFLGPIRRTAYKIMSKFEIYDNLKGIINHALDLGIVDGMYDAIISSSDPKSSHLFVSKLYESGLVKSTPWIQIWGDPFLSDFTRKSNVLNSKVKKEEDRLLKYASKVVYVSNLTLKEQQKTYSHYAAKMCYEPIPYVKEEDYAVEDTQKKSLTFLYCGDYSADVRNIKPLYDAVINSGHKMIICGSSNLELGNTDRIEIHQRVGFEKTKEFERSCDVLVHLSNLKGTQIPGKIYQYSGTNKPILFILDGDEKLLKETFDKYERYIFCRNDKEDISQVMEKISAGEFDHTRFVVEDFKPRKIAERILQM